MPLAFRPHILVVDDEPCIREVLAAAPEDTYVVHAAATGAAALALLQTQPIAAVLLDLVLQDEHGLDVVPRLRPCVPVPIAILTGRSSEEALLRRLRDRVDEYLKKPIDLHELRAALRRLVPQTGSASDIAERARQYLDAHNAGPCHV